MKKRILFSLSLVSTVLFTPAHALDTTPIRLDRPHVVSAQTNNFVNGNPQMKRIGFMRIIATPLQQKAFMSYDINTPPTLKVSQLFPPTASYKYMSFMPVLDQGAYGTCATFSNTAAIDTVLFNDATHRISQLCNLTLGRSFDQSAEGPAAMGYTPSGWNGTFGGYVLEQIERFGIVPVSKEATGLCGGLTKYPVAGGPIPRATAPQVFFPMSTNIMSMIDWTGILVSGQRMMPDPANPFNGPDMLNKVKQVITANNSTTGSRLLVTIGFQLYASLCNMGTCAKKSGSVSQTTDTWVLSNEITSQTGFPTDGHEVIVFGYDDNAVAIDKAGVTHKGLLMIRNSWGPNMGDNGNYYMSYDYFYKYVNEIYEIRTLPFRA